MATKKQTDTSTLTLGSAQASTSTAQPTTSTAGDVQCRSVHAGWKERCKRSEHPPDEHHDAGQGVRWMDGEAGSRGGDPVPPHPTATTTDQAQATTPAPPPAAQAPQQVAQPRPAPQASPRAQAPQQVAQPRQSPLVGRMALPTARSAQAADDTQGPWRMFMYGVPKIGKTTFGVDADAPIFVPVERSPNVPAAMCFPQPEKWQEVLDAITVLGTADHAYRTVVIDTADALEPLLAQVIKQKAKTGAGSGKGEVHYMGDVGGGYGKAEEAMVEEVQVLLQRLERLQQVKGMNVLILAHAAVGKVSNPDAADFDMWQPRLPKKVAGAIMGWADIIGFATEEIQLIQQAGKRGKVKGGEVGARWLLVGRSRATYWAGNRHNLPPRLPLDYQAFATALEQGARMGVADLIAGVRAKATLLTGHTFMDRAGREVTFTEWVDRQLAAQPPPNRGVLLKIDSRLAAKLQELEAPATGDDGEPGGEGGAA